MKENKTDIEKVSISEVFKDNLKIFVWVFVLWLIFFIGTVWIGNDLSFDLFNPSMKLTDLGTFGDSFNVLTSLFTGLAFAGVIISIILQTQELKATREELQGQKEALVEQQREMEVQSFDNKFFQMLNSYNLSMNNVKMGKTREGSQVYEELERNFKGMILQEATELLSFQNIFNKFSKRYNFLMKFNFINLYQILKFVDSNKNDSIVKKDYTNILRAQLSKSKLVLLYFNAIGIIESNGKEYKELIEKYSFFEHLNYQDLFNYKNAEISSRIQVYVDELLVQYDKKAFGKNTQLIEKWEELKAKSNTLHIE
ncbi:MAG: Unknown protein [uncultured Sulfurovum sp.]|uniref:Phage abortive infection protein n=1 Tax=uncultured Sulfurovum sp. TaxID=269237 RepID=A0A6S6TQL1_9BACT|nr:MAG: Unknown protein [uncultured Sulfurovum sp.]